MKNPLIAPSMLSANFLNLQEDINMVNTSNADWFHIDVMDGVFVPNISFGFPVISHIKKLAQKPLDVHLMIVNPDKYIEDFVKVGADYITVHYEACSHLHRTLQSIKKAGAKAGVVLNPHSSVDLLDDVLMDCDLVLLMSVNPGFGGQKFIENAYRKIAKLKDKIIQQKLSTLIEVDGGVDATNAAKLVECGADVLVAGSYVFNSPNPKENINKIKYLAS